MIPLDAPVLRWIEAAVGPGAKIVAVHEMPPSATQKHAVDVESAAGTIVPLVLQRFHDAGRLRSDPWYLPANEAAVLAMLEETEVPAPSLFAADLGPEVSVVPTILMSRLPGRSLWAPADGIDRNRFLRRSAEVLVSIHARGVSPDAFPSYEPYFRDEELHVPVWAGDPSVWERAIDIATASLPASPRSFIHRDYHGGNVMWNERDIAGVVDWTTGCWGPPGIDLARMRVNLIDLMDRAAADGFLDDYRAAGGAPGHHDPRWDLIDLVDFVVVGSEPPEDAAEAASLARLESFAADALASLAG